MHAPVSSTPPSSPVWNKSAKELFPETSSAPAAAGINKTSIATIPVLSAPPAAAGSDPFGRLSVSPEKLKADFEESKEEWKERAPRPLTIRINETTLSAMRFSQASISRQTKAEMSLTDLEASIRGRWDGPPLPVVRYKDGSMTSLGNRRLHVMQEIIRKGGRLSVKARIHDADDIAPQDVVNAERQSYLDRLFRIVKSPRRDYAEMLADQHVRSLEKYGISMGTYGEWVYLRTRSDWNYHPKDGEAVTGYELTPFFH